MGKKHLARWIDVNQKKRWGKTRGCNHSKKLLNKSLQKQTREILRMCRKEARSITAFLTGHGNFRGHLHKLGIEIPSKMCRYCEESEETALHILTECLTLARIRFNSFEMNIMEIPQENLIQKISNFIKDLRWNNE